MKAHPPRAVGGTRDFDLTGMFVPFHRGQPCLLSMPLSEKLYIACFERDGDIEPLLERAEVPFDKVCRVTEGREFLLSVPGTITVIVNPRFTDEGKLRFFELFRD